MQINGNIDVQGFTRVADLECGAVFAFCDDSEVLMKGSDAHGYDMAVRLEDGAVYDVEEEGWVNRPVRQIKAVLTIH